jgi:hypothetical protein
MRAAGWPSRARGRTWCGPSTPLPVPPWAVRCDSCPSRQGCTDFWDRSARARTGLSGARSRSQRQASGGTGSCARSAAAGLAPRSWTSIEGRYRGWPAPKDSDFRARSVKSYGLRSVSPQSAQQVWSDRPELPRVLRRGALPPGSRRALTGLLATVVVGNCRRRLDPARVAGVRRRPGRPSLVVHEPGCR